VSDRFNVGLGATLGGAAGFLGGAAVYGHRNRAVQANAAFWGMALGGVFGAVIGALIYNLAAGWVGGLEVEIT
jgi:hypothetical protein